MSVLTQDNKSLLCSLFGFTNQVATPLRNTLSLSTIHLKSRGNFSPTWRRGHRHTQLLPLTLLKLLRHLFRAFWVGFSSAQFNTFASRLAHYLHVWVWKHFLATLTSPNCEVHSLRNSRGRMGPLSSWATQAAPLGADRRAGCLIKVRL